jgi:hypothetical protein
VLVRAAGRCVDRDGGRSAQPPQLVAERITVRNASQCDSQDGERRRFPGSNSGLPFTRLVREQPCANNGGQATCNPQVSGRIPSSVLAELDRIAPRTRCQIMAIESPNLIP